MENETRLLESKILSQQETRGPHHLPDKQSRSINIFAQSNDYAITLRGENHCLLFEK